MSWQDCFVDRPAELEVLSQSWAKAKRGVPQFVGIVAEQGFGKTRLVQRLFEELSTTEDGSGAAGWWPDSLQDSQAFDCVTPALRDQPEGAMPFLWWGIRLRDPGDAGIRYTTELSSARDTLRSYLRKELSLRAKHERYRKMVGTGAKLAMDIAIEQAANAASLGFAGTLKSIGEAGKQIYDIQKADGLGQDHVNDIISDLRAVCALPVGQLNPIPMCLFIDDYQFLSADLEACRLLDELSLVARSEGWPLLILVTSWERGWKGEVNQTRMKGWGLECSTIDLGPLAMETLVREALPGLTQSQVAMFLERSEGNPRSLKYLLANLIDDHRYLFEGRDTSCPLTPEGETYVHSQTHDKVVAERFAGSPEEVKSLLATASVQGISFAPPVAIQMSKLLNLAAGDRGIVKAERPYAFITVKGPDFAEFRQANVWRAASAWLPNLADARAAQEAYQQALTSLAKEAERKQVADGSDEVIARERLVDEDPWRRQEGRTALMRMFFRSRDRREFAVSAAVAKRWLESIDLEQIDDIRHGFDRRVTELSPLIEFLKQGPEREDLCKLLDDGFWRLLSEHSKSPERALIKFPAKEEEFYAQRTTHCLLKLGACIALHARDLFAPHIALAAGEVALEILESAVRNNVIPIDWDDADMGDSSFAQYNLVLYHDLLHAVNVLQSDPTRKRATESELIKISPLMMKHPIYSADEKLQVLLAAQDCLRSMQLEMENRNRQKASELFSTAIAELNERVTRSPEPATLGMLAETYALGLRVLHGNHFWPRSAKRLATEGLEVAIRAYQAGLERAMCTDSFVSLSMKAGRLSRKSKIVNEFAPIIRQDIRNLDHWVIAETGTSKPLFIPRQVILTHAQFCFTSSEIQRSLGNRSNALEDLDLTLSGLSSHIDYRNSLRNASISWRTYSIAAGRALGMGSFVRWRLFTRQARTIAQRAEQIARQHGLELNLWDFAKAEVPDLFALDSIAPTEH